VRSERKLSLTIENKTKTTILHILKDIS